MSDAITLPVENEMSYHPHDYHFVGDRISRFPYHMQKTVENTYGYHYQQYEKESEGRREANLWLLDAVEYTQNKSLLVIDDDNLKIKAERMAELFKPLSFCAAGKELARWGLEMPEGETEESTLARLHCPMWWSRSLRRKQDKEHEMLAIQLGFVRKGYQPYCSTALLKRVQARQERAKAIMEQMEAVSSEGDVLNMWEVLDKSIANPAVRRAELMVRMRGMEEYSTEAGHVGMFYTITCPSKYHRYSGRSLNPKYQNYTPKEAQAYLSGVWARIRAKLKRDGLNVYGFRVAEPHHDGCPHWHMLLFMEQAHCEDVTATLQAYAMAEDGQEAGADKHRFEAVHISKEKGSATGYIAKYISKNIDAFGMEADGDSESGFSASDSAKRVKAWASVWNIRQFQQIGGAPVGVWRELRRVESAPDGLMEEARQAADSGDWCEYLKLQAGGDADRKLQPLRTYQVQPVEQESGKLKTNRYGEAVQVVKGITDTWTGESLETRTKEWTIQAIEKQEGEAVKPIVFEVAPHSEYDVLADIAGIVADAEFLQAGESFAFPWSSVNNCTRPNYDGADIRFY